VQEGLLQKSGSWYSYGEERIGQGKDKVRQYLKDNPAIAQEVEQKIREKLLPSKTDATPTSE
jgi:recombination protein RecA